jgi:hypothetical protein
MKEAKESFLEVDMTLDSVMWLYHIGSIGGRSKMGISLSSIFGNKIIINKRFLFSGMPFNNSFHTKS